MKESTTYEKLFLQVIYIYCRFHMFQFRRILVVHLACRMQHYLLASHSHDCDSHAPTFENVSFLFVLFNLNIPRNLTRI